MKKIKFLAMALAALTIASCSEEKAVTNNEVVPELRVSIAGGKSRATEEDGKGDENKIIEFAAFAKIEATGNYECKVGTTDVAFTGVVLGSPLYVIANAAKSGGTVPYTADKADYTEADIQAMSILVTKPVLNGFTTKLQEFEKSTETDKTLTFETGNAMVMTGKSTASGTPTAGGKINVEVALDREFARVDAESAPLAYTTDFAVADKGNLATIDGTKNYIVRRVASSVVGFSSVPSITSQLRETGANDAQPTDLSGGYRFVYRTGLTATATATAPEAKNFYVTSNDALALLGSTVVVYEVQFTALADLPANTMPGQPDVIAKNAKFSRYYKAYITSAAQDTEFVTVKGSYYQFSNKINGWGAATEEDVVDKETVDLNVTVVVKPWEVKPITVDME